MKEKSFIAILNNFCIALEGINTKIHELAIVIEEDGGRSFLIIASVARIKDLYS